MKVKKVKKTALFMVLTIMSIGLFWGYKEIVKAADIAIVVYYSNGGNGIAPSNHVMYSQVNNLPVPVREDYIFEGWCTDPELNYPVTAPFTITSEVNAFYAKWREIIPINMTVSYTENTAIVDSLLDPNKIIVKATLSNNTTRIITDFEIVDLKVAALGTNTFTITYKGASATFTVFGIEQVFYTIKYESNGGTVISDVPGIKPGETISLPAEPVKNGYTFDGWYRESSFTNRYTKDTPINGNVTVYAKWILDVVIVEEVVYELNTYAVTLKVNQQASLFIETYDPYLEWDVKLKSSNKKVATVTSDDESKGIITAKAKGNATISVTAPDGSVLKCKVSVGSKVAAKTIKTNVSSKKIKVNKTFTIKTTIAPKNVSSKKLTYTSSNKKIATVSSNGKVTGKKKGTCIITVKTTDGSNLSKKVKVTVS